MLPRHGLMVAQSTLRLAGGMDSEDIETATAADGSVDGDARDTDVLGAEGDANEGAWYREALRAAPEDSELHFEHAVFLQSGGDNDGAERAYRRVLTLDPNNVEALCNYGSLQARPCARAPVRPRARAPARPRARAPARPPRAGGAGGARVADRWGALG